MCNVCGWGLCGGWGRGCRSGGEERMMNGGEGEGERDGGMEERRKGEREELEISSCRREAGKREIGRERGMEGGREREGEKKIERE